MSQLVVCGASREIQRKKSGLTMNNGIEWSKWHWSIVWGWGLVMFYVRTRSSTPGHTSLSHRRQRGKLRQMGGKRRPGFMLVIHRTVWKNCGYLGVPYSSRPTSEAGQLLTPVTGRETAGYYLPIYIFIITRRQCAVQDTPWPPEAGSQVLISWYYQELTIWWFMLIGRILHHSFTYF